MEGEGTPAIKKDSISDKIADKIIERLSNSQKKKKEKDKPLFKFKLSKSMLNKGYVTVLFLKANATSTQHKLKIEDGSVYFKEKDLYYMAEGNHIWNFKGKPFILQPDWSVEPITRDLLVEESKKNGTDNYAQKYTVKIAEQIAAGMKPKASFGGMKIILWVVIAIVVIYLISMLMGKKLF